MEQPPKIRLYQHRLAQYHQKVTERRGELRVFSIVVLVIWTLSALACGSLYFLSLYWYPHNQIQNTNLQASTEFQWTGGSGPADTGCTKTCSANFRWINNNNITHTWATPSNWDLQTSHMDDVHVTFDWGLFLDGNPGRHWIEIYSNNVLWGTRELNMQEIVCGKCKSLDVFIQGAFQPIEGLNRTVWEMNPQENNISFAVRGGNSIYITKTTLKMKFDTIQAGYADLIAHLWYAAIACSFLVVLIPVGLGGQLCRVACTEDPVSEKEWVRRQMANTPEIYQHEDNVQLLGDYRVEIS